MKNLKIFIAGHNGMVGKSLVNFFRKKKIGKLILASRKELNLENFIKVEKFVKIQKPNVIINCAGKVGGILANSSYPTEFLNENILIQTNLIQCLRCIQRGQTGVSCGLNLSLVCGAPLNKTVGKK